MNIHDARAVYTRQTIEKEFLKLLKTKPVSKITVSELCTVCHINRATFYKHYTDIYGLMDSMEQIMTDVQKANPDMNVILLRYFNPVGAHESGRIGEDPKGIPNNLMPYISQVAVGKLEKLGVFGDDYDTPDGTGVRDYIHVVDLAKGHVKAIDYIFSNPGLDVINLGTGVGYSVLDMVKAFGKACGKEIPYEIKPRRAGDIAMCYADPAKAAKVLGWKAEKGLDEMCADTWRWQSQNPNGYEA